jgi:prevent-host-death family protein
MDRAVTATEANQRFSEILREVAAGNSVTVTSRGKPVARIVPLEAEDRKERIRQLVEKVKTWPPTYVAPWTRDELYD